MIIFYRVMLFQLKMPTGLEYVSMAAAGLFLFTTINYRYVAKANDAMLRQAMSLLNRMSPFLETLEESNDSLLEISQSLLVENEYLRKVIAETQNKQK